MATSRQKGGCWISFPDDDERDDSGAVIIQETALVEAPAEDISSTPPRRSTAFGLETPLATPDSRSRLHAIDYCSVSPPCTPPRLRDIPKDTKPSTLPRKLSEQSKESTASITWPSSAGLPTPENTPPRKLRPTSPREETKVKLESSPLRNTTSSAAEAILWKDTELLPNKLTVITKPKNDPRPVSWEKIQCSGITTKKRQCRIWVYQPDRYCGHHHNQDTGSPAHISPTKVEGQQPEYQSEDTAANPTVELNWQCRGITLRGVRCKRTVRPPTQHCHQHLSAIPPTTPTCTARYTAPNLTTEQNAQCRGITLRGVQCKRAVKPPVQHCYQHIPETTPTAPTSTLRYVALDLTTEQNAQCHGITLRGIQCKRTVKPPVQYCNLHISASHDILGAPTTPITPITLTGAFQKSVQCSAKTKSTGRRCQLRISIVPGQPTNGLLYCRHHTSTPVGIAKNVNNEGFIVQRRGLEEVFVRFCDYIPAYLQGDTQQKLQAAITRNLSERDKIPGYIYALNVTDPEQEGKLSWKVGYSKDVKQRYACWRRQCPSFIKSVRGWWPRTINQPNDYDESLIQMLIAGNQQGPAGAMAEQVERLVHIELADLATHAPYLHPDFPNVHYSDVPYLKKAAPRPCSDCNVKHKEIFSFRRVEEGEYFGREWEYIVQPVIKKWGLFLTEYFAEDA